MSPMIIFHMTINLNEIGK